MPNNAPLKLTIVSQLFYPEMVSTGQTITELAIELTNQGVEVDVLCGNPTVLNTEKVASTLTHKGVRIQRLWSTRFPKLNLLGKLCNHLTFTASTFMALMGRRFSHQRKTPLLVLTNPPMVGIAAAIQRLIGGSPYLYLVFDVYPETAIRAGLLKRYGVISSIWKLVNAAVVKLSSNVIVIGRCMKTLFSQVPPQKLTHIHVWADDAMIQIPSNMSQDDIGKKTQVFKDKWELNGKFVVMYSGNIARFHDMETIMEAAAILKDDPDIVFMFIGEGYKKKQCQDIAVQQNLNHCVFDTYVDKKDLPFSLSLASIGLVSLLPGQEGLSVPSKTYGLLAAGIPVAAIMPDTSEIALMLTETTSGKVIKNGDSKALASFIREAKQNPSILAHYKDNAIQAIQQKFSLKIAANQYVNLIKTL